MNNRYIFRGKREDNGQWIYGDLIIDQYSKYYIHPNTNAFSVNECNLAKCIQMIEVIPETVGQCTGLKDKDGKPIFERDILESRASENKEDWKRWVAIFSDGSFCFEREIPRKRRYKYEQNLLCADEIELYGLNVIGNICDNPELLKESDTNE